MEKHMGASDENIVPVLMKPKNVPGTMILDERKFGMENRQIRRPLGVINQSIIGVYEQNPCGVKKRVFENDNGTSEKIIPVPPHRPITRNFAAQTGSSKLLHPPYQEIKKPKVSGHRFGVREDTPIRDMEAKPMPMSLEKRKEVSHETDQMEVEMEDVFEEPLPDIDVGDAKNPLAAADYVEDLYAHYRNMEGSSCISPHYMTHQSDINAKMRAILIDWLIEVNYKFELRSETLFLTVNLLDRFLEKKGVERKKLQLVGLVAMFLACKYEEVSVPVLEDLIFISDKAYTRKEILEMETLMLNTLQFNMSVPTAYVFMQRYLKAAQSNKELYLLSFFLIELCLVEYEMLKFPPTLMAAAAIYTAQCTLYGTGQWNKACEWHTKYSKDQLLECSRMIASYHQKASTGKLTGVHRKYSTSKFGFAANCEPAKFLE